MKFSDNTEKILLLKQIDRVINICKVEIDGNLTELFEITELTGDVRMSASIDENDNYHVLVTGANGSLEIVYEEETNIIQNLQNTQISIFPNPTNGIINIETQEEINKITVLDVTGKMILETTNTKIDLTNKKKGIYILKIQTINGIFTETIIKE
ncbi:MAG: T9SS type A sorting domain-containing protein [Bacteroidota bacterium]|nr:T9SS type A sorting domain-containing protein [Bacteroidota bacterium]